MCASVLWRQHRQSGRIQLERNCSNCLREAAQPRHNTHTHTYKHTHTHFLIGCARPKTVILSLCLSVSLPPSLPLPLYLSLSLSHTHTGGCTGGVWRSARPRILSLPRSLQVNYREFRKLLDPNIRQIMADLFCRMVELIFISFTQSLHCCC